ELAEHGYTVETAAGIRAARQALVTGHIDVVISDLRLPDGNGMDLLGALRAQPGGPGIVLITAFGSVPQAVEALKAGADDFLTKPVDLEHLVLRVDRVLAQRRARADLDALRGQSEFHGMVGSSAAMQRVYTAIRQVARSPE